MLSFHSQTLHSQFWDNVVWLLGASRDTNAVATTSCNQYSKDLTLLENVLISIKVKSTHAHLVSQLCVWKKKKKENQIIAKYYILNAGIEASLQRTLYTFTAYFWSLASQLKLLVTFLQLTFQVLTLGWQFCRVASFICLFAHQI